MTHKKLPFSAQKTLKFAHNLDNPIVLFSGRNKTSSKNAILTFAPQEIRTCFSLSDIQRFISSIPAALSNGSSDLFRSGWIGYFSYEAGHAQLLNNQRTTQPLAEFFECPLTVELDLETDEVWLHNPRALNDDLVDPFIQALAALQNHQETSCAKTRNWMSAWNAEQYQQAFNKTHQYLRAGDCYQVNLAVPFYCADDLTQQSPLPLFEQFDPTFGAYMRTPHLTLFSVSPERFIRIEGDCIETRPIKGTIARGKTEQEDQANKEWLANSSKNQAENLMIVDLLRNDLSKHAEPFSVKVDELFHIETHANVHHMVSTIRAKKRIGTNTADVIFDALPGGSITGAPKKRAMEIINELEADARGVYCGVFGYFDDSGLSDFNILIRTICATKQGANCWAGGGVVMDSTWQDEWQELHTKVRRILDTPL